MNLFIPENMQPLDFTYANEVAYLCHAVTERRVFNKELREVPYVPLKATVLREILGRRKALPAMEEALSRGVLYTSGSYSPGAYSRLYALGPDYRDMRARPYPLSPGRLLDNLKEYRKARHKEYDAESTGIYATLLADLKLIEIGDIVEEDLWGWCGGDVIKYNCAAMSVDKIRDKDFFGTKCKNGRFHTNVTNLKRELRAKLTIKGQPLRFYDISCSQPLFLGLLAKNSLLHIQSNTIQPPTPPSTHYDGHLDDNEIKTYIHQCTTNTFYSNIAQTLNITRDQAKHRVMLYLFDEPWKPLPVNRYMATHFPSIDALARWMKRDSRANLANCLQSAESDMVIGRVCSRLKREHPKLHLITVHDSIGTTCGNEDIIRDMMMLEFQGLGVEPLLKPGC